MLWKPMGYVGKAYLQCRVFRTCYKMGTFVGTGLHLCLINLARSWPIKMQIKFCCKQS